MPEPDNFHAWFAAAMRGGDDAALAPFLTDGEAGLAVHRNSIASAVIEALEQAYPAVRRLVGERFFRALAQAYWDRHAPSPPGLLLYGDGFSDFISGWGPARPLPYLADIARLDRAWLEAHHAEDAEPMTLRQAFGAHKEGEAPARLHPGARILASRYPAYAIWKTNREDDEARFIRLDDGGQTALVWRKNGEVRHRRTSPAQHAALTRLSGCARLLDAAQAAAQAGSEDPVALIAELLQAGVLAPGGEGGTGQ